MHGKKYNNAKQHVSAGAVLSPKDAFNKVKAVAFAKFDESVDLNINLGIDPSKGEQVVRGSVILPHKIGKNVRVLVFAKGDYIDQALTAGADYVGAEELIEKIEGGWMEFDVALATPDLMGLVSKLAKQLGPKGLLPNKKLGTVTFDVASVVTDLKRGRTFFKNDKSGLVHFRIGKVSFSNEHLIENFTAFVKALASVRPPTAKGKFIQKVTASSSMGPGVQVNPELAID
ncbi:MAG: 50S ribosomal protein L1 [Candidatus Babeliales bacterium]